LAYHQKALPIREAVSDRAGQAATLGNIGKVYHNLRQWDEAIGYYQKALSITESIEDRTGQATALNNIGALYFDQGQWDKAIGYYQKALPIWEAVSDRVGQATVLNNIGALYDGLGQWDEAIGYYQKALSITESIDNRAGERFTRLTWYYMALHYRAQEKLAEEVGAWRKVVELDKRMQHPELEWDEVTLYQVEQEWRQRLP
jgi:tetratricopeptide (TPR) repeat protein